MPSYSETLNLEKSYVLECMIDYKDTYIAFCEPSTCIWADECHIKDCHTKHVGALWLTWGAIALCKDHVREFKEAEHA